MLLTLPLLLVVAHTVDGLFVEQEPEYQLNKLVNGEHFDDLVDKQDNSFTARMDTILLIHNSQCPNTAKPDYMPGIAFMMFLTHNVNSMKYIWYDYTPAQDLYKRYAQSSKSCQTAVFIKKDQKLDSRGRIYVPETDGTLEFWAWTMMIVFFTVRNEYGEDLIVKFKGGAKWPTMHDVMVYEGEAVKIQSYPGNTARVFSQKNQNLLYQTVIETAKQDVTIRPFMTIPDLDKVYKRIAETDQYNYNWLQHNSDRAVLILKQPIFVKNFTAQGYEKVKIPQDVFDYIHGIYTDRYAQISPERVAWQIESQVINQKEIRTSMVELTDAEKIFIGNALIPVLDEWCSCSLEWTMAWGIREYYKGNVLLRHVDKLTTHAISVILQVHQELDGADWELETINFTGDRSRMTLAKGEMLIYESAKLIHARPDMFEGSKYANAFFHFAPVGWPYHHEKAFIIDDSTGRRENVLDIETTLTKESGLRPSINKDEL